jgi:RsiW-degrading membrane proteinase PrsW (M82 family)
LRAAVDFVDTYLLRGVGFAAGGALFWLLYFDLKDRLQPEPRRLLVVAFLLGFVAAGLGLGLYRLTALAGLPDYPDPSTRSILFYTMVLVGPIEEGAKFLVARVVIFRWKQFDEPIDGLIYSSAVAIGFASLESLLYAPHAGWPELLARAITAPLSHWLFAAPWGFGLAHARLAVRSPAGRLLWQVLPLLGAMLLHGFYDFALLAWDATWLAAGLALVLWLAIMVHARRLLHRRAVSLLD